MGSRQRQHRRHTCQLAAAPCPAWPRADSPCVHGRCPGERTASRTAEAGAAGHGVWGSCLQQEAAGLALPLHLPPPPPISQEKTGQGPGGQEARSSLRSGARGQLGLGLAPLLVVLLVSCFLCPLGGGGVLHLSLSDPLPSRSQASPTLTEHWDPGRSPLPTWAIPGGVWGSQVRLRVWFSFTDLKFTFCV